jgi:hypothetical protein
MSDRVKSLLIVVGIVIVFSLLAVSLTSLWISCLNGNLGACFLVR